MPPVPQSPGPVKPAPAASSGKPPLQMGGLRGAASASGAALLGAAATTSGGGSEDASGSSGGTSFRLPAADTGLSFSEWLEALMRVALFKWNDGAMSASEKLARVVDALAVRLTTAGVDTRAHDDGGPLIRAAAVRLADAAKAAAARAAAERGPTLMGGR